MQIGLTRDELMGLIASKADALAKSIYRLPPPTDHDIDVEVSRIAALTQSLFQGSGVVQAQEAKPLAAVPQAAPTGP